jgi:hypothetical protein
VKQKYGEGENEYGSVKFKQEPEDENTFSEGDTSSRNGGVGLTGRRCARLQNAHPEYFVVMLLANTRVSSK